LTANVLSLRVFVNLPLHFKANKNFISFIWKDSQRVHFKSKGGFCALGGADGSPGFGNPDASGSGKRPWA
jgi:hypothetical protein